MKDRIETIPEAAHRLLSVVETGEWPEIVTPQPITAKVAQHDPASTDRALEAECREEGKQAFLDDVRFQENPYQEGTLSYKSWMTGWVEAKRRNDIDWSDEPTPLPATHFGEAADKLIEKIEETI